jgi:hypothetical protein
MKQASIHHLEEEVLFVYAFFLKLKVVRLDDVLHQVDVLVEAIG